MRTNKIVEQAGALVFRSVGGRPEVLLVTAKKNPKHWIFPKGHLEPGEDHASAALREAREEAGVVGRVVGPLCPALKFRSGSERVRVQYFLVAAENEVTTGERRERKWLEPNAALATVSHSDARQMLLATIPDIREQAALDVWPAAEQSSEPNDEPFRGLLSAEYQHIAESLLRNEEDGEKRVTFFLTLTAAAGAVLAFMLGDEPDLSSMTVHPLVAGTLVVMLAFGYFTLVRVVTRNAASDAYKRALNRIRRYFLSGPKDSRLVFLSFDPFRRVVRPRARWTSIGRGGWLETVVLVESLLLGALVATLVPTPNWWWDALAALAGAFVGWVTLLPHAQRRYNKASLPTRC